jgi:PadR family transcriptional regulator PadR
VKSAGLRGVTNKFAKEGLTKPHSLRHYGGVMRKSNPNFLNGVPELLVLKLLSRREMYGYEIVKAIKTETRQALSFGEGCIYPYLHYLEEEKLLSSRRKEVGGRSRNYYQLTRRGIRRLEQLNTDWDRVTSGISLLMQGKHA